MLTLIVLIVGLVPALLKNIPGISPRLQQLIADTTGATTAILGSGVISGPNVTTVLAAWAGVITALKADPNLPADSLIAIAQVEKIVQAVLTEDAELAKAVDWTKINLITPVA